MFLYYNTDKKRWQLFSRVGSEKCGAFLETERAPHMAVAENECWQVWKCPPEGDNGLMSMIFWMIRISIIRMKRMIGMSRMSDE